MEEDKVSKIAYTFKISVPESASQSDFNSLVIRLHYLKCFIESNAYDKNNIEIISSNRNIEEMQQLLENFKMKKVDFNE